MSLWAYLWPALLLLLEVGFPLGVFVPGGDTLLLALGALAGKEKLSLFPLLPLLFLGSFLGHGLGYGLGRILGPKLLKRFPERLRPGANRFLNRFGPPALLLARAFAPPCPSCWGPWAFPGYPTWPSPPWEAFFAPKAWCS